MTKTRFSGPLLRWVVFGIAVSVSCFFVSGTGQARSTKQAPRQAIVAQVIDGDTIELGTGEKVRYLGINAPEVRVKRGSRWVVQPQPCGKEASTFNRSLVEGKDVQLEYDADIEDDYGRLLAYVRVDDVLVNGELVKKGLALVDVRKPNFKHRSELVQLQREAKERRIGIWSVAERLRIEADDASAHLDELALVSGTITSVSRGKGKGKGKVYLHFDGDSHSHFTAIIYRDHLDILIPAGSDPSAAFQNRQAQVYGFIRRMPGPAIIICAPSQIDILE